MIDISRARELIEIVHKMAPLLNDDEVNDIGRVLIRATDRLVDEAYKRNEKKEMAEATKNKNS